MQPMSAILVTPLTRMTAIALALATPCLARADALDDILALELGSFAVNTNTTVRLDGSAGRGTPVDLEHELGLQNTTSFRIDGYWRFATHHKIRIMYFQEGKSGERVIDQQIVFGNVTYPVNTDVAAHVGTHVAEIAYEYAFLRGEHYELAGSFGLHDLSFDTSLSAVGNTLNASLSERATVNGPLPVIGVHYVYQFNQQLNIDALFQFFMLKFDQYDGNLQDYNLSLIYMPWKNFGIGAGWNEFVTDLDVSANGFNGNLRWRYGGLRLFLRLSY
jgi:hypothetical protein